MPAAPLPKVARRKLSGNLKNSTPIMWWSPILIVPQKLKTLSDIVCTSSNAEKIINSIPREKPIIFAPDKNLGRYLMEKTGRKMLLWDGACIVHEAFSLGQIAGLVKLHPTAQIIAHPESESHILKVANYVGSTSGMLNYVKNSEKEHIYCSYRSRNPPPNAKRCAMENSNPGPCKRRQYLCLQRVCFYENEYPQKAV